MYAVVMYESLFGNSREVAEAVAAGVADARPTAVVDCRCVDAVGSTLTVSTADLVVVGGPTHFWGMTSRISRAMEHEYELRMMPGRQPGRRHLGSRRQAAGTAGVRYWLTTIPAGHRTPAAAFDTRMDRAASGGAAPAIARHLDRRDYRLVTAPRAFVVTGVTGPVPAEQLEQARQWGRHLASAAGAHPRRRG